MRMGDTSSITRLSDVALTSSLQAIEQTRPSTNFETRPMPALTRAEELSPLNSGYRSSAHCAVTPKR